MLKVIFDRRTIRKYKNDVVNKTMLEQILKAATCAPFASTSVPVRFIVCDNKMIIADLKKIHPYGKALETAPIAVVVCADVSSESTKGVYVSDCAAATQNMLLAAQSFNLGSCWIGVHPWEELAKQIKEYFELPEKIVPYSIVSIGYSAEEVEKKEKFDPSFVHLNEW